MKAPAAVPLPSLPPPLLWQCTFVHDSLLPRPPQDVMGPWFRGRVLNKDAMEAAMGQVGAWCCLRSLRVVPRHACELLHLLVNAIFSPRSPLFSLLPSPPFPPSHAALILSRSMTLL